MSSGKFTSSWHWPHSGCCKAAGYRTSPSQKGLHPATPKRGRAPGSRTSEDWAPQVPAKGDFPFKSTPRLVLPAPNRLTVERQVRFRANSHICSEESSFLPPSLSPGDSNNKETSGFKIQGRLDGDPSSSSMPRVIHLAKTQISATLLHVRLWETTSASGARSFFVPVPGVWVQQSHRVGRRGADTSLTAGSGGAGIAAADSLAVHPSTLSSFSQPTKPRILNTLML